MNKEKYWIWLSRLGNEIEPIVLKKLLDEYKMPDKIWKLTKTKLKKFEIKQEHVDVILNKKYKENLEVYEKYLLENNIEILTIYDKFYPEKLKHIYDPPIVLYLKGDKNILNNLSLAIIGSRNCSFYGMQVAKDIAKNLSKYEINITSGLARGIDASAHIGSLSGNGKTVAVLGTGLDTIYPAENKELANKIIKTGGAIISEFIVGSAIKKTNFPKRNRIISGMSDGVLVVEAAKQSGTFITVDYALEQGKTVYAVPGNITSINSYGTNELIKDGAKMVTNLKDILEDFVEKNM